MYYAIRIGFITKEQPTRSIQACETYDDALKKFHGDIGNNIGSCEEVACLLVGDQGEVYKTEYWKKPVSVTIEESGGVE